MFNRKNKLSLSIGIAVLTASAYSSAYDSRSAAMGGTGVASGDYTSGSLNPALIGAFSENDDFNVNLNGGILVADRDDLYEAIEDTQDLITELESKSMLSLDDADALNSSLQSMSNKFLTGQLDSSLNIYLPNSLLSAGIIVKNNTRMGVGFQYDENDASQIVAGSSLQSDNLQSSVMIGGVSISDVGLAVSRDVVGDVKVGVNAKMQRVDIFGYSEGINQFEIDNYDDYMSDESNFNLDIGVYKNFGDFHVGVTGYNMITNTYQNDAINYTVEPNYVAGVAYSNGWVRVELNQDLNPRAGMSMNTGEVIFEESLLTKIGAELNAFNWAQVRVGYMHDSEEDGRVSSDVFTAGLGLSPFDIFNLDISASYSEENAYGLSAQFGISF